MRFKIIVFLFVLIFSVGYSEGVEGHKVKLLEEKISDKEMELEELKVLYQELLEKKSITDYPKIGLVLSGGGAKGIAHIGVLKMLEEYGINVDYITGTSFGSIVGALYAVGYSSDEIEKIVKEIDWDSFKNDKQARKYTSLKYKIQREKYFMNLEIDEDYNLKFPKGVLTGEAFYLELKSLLFRAEGIDDFDNLEIPFRAISTNINTGERNVVGKGDLAKAVFMSMAIPTILDPVEDNGEYYVDGGLIENLPVKEVIEMGADIVIAIDISADSNVIEDNSNIFEVLEKMTTYKSEEQFEKAKNLSDILIIPDVKDHSIADFTGLDELISKGKIEAKKHEKKLKELKNTPRDNKGMIKEKDLIRIEKVTLIGNKSLTEGKVLGISGKGLPEDYTKEEIGIWMKKIKGLSIIKRFFYVIEENNLIINVKENEAQHIRLGMNYSDDYGAKLRIVTDKTRYGLVDNEYMVMAEISKYPKLEFETITDYRLNESQYMGLLGLGISTEPLFIYDKDDKISDYNNYELYISAGLGTSLFNSYLLATKFYYIGVKNEYMSGSKDFIEDSHWEYSKNRTILAIDTRDNAYFPTKGVNNRIELFTGANITGRSVEFYGGLYDFHRYLPLNQKFNLELAASGGKIAGASVPENEHFKLGGIRNRLQTNQFSFYGMNAMRKHVDEFYMAALALRYSLNSSMYLNLKYNAVTYNTLDEFSFIEKERVGENFEHGIGVGLGWDTLVGPLEFVVSNDVDSESILFSLFLGYEF
ncbi:patatin-like phospholipase family protein [Psychrilyobacter atlanticus]|uniref:patatin-like phospholipase family protein n=1 Tax=Psychrilyobacter atlanticus TaxID=271091 RepID=UPI00040D07BD|nr:patatin-like phospholipase family protein [Psychrilyobacter atlanticus]